MSAGTKTIWVWQLADESLRILQVGSPCPSSGTVYEVKETKSRMCAERSVRWFLAEAPDLLSDGQAFLSHARAQKFVSVVRFTTESEEA